MLYVSFREGSKWLGSTPIYKPRKGHVEGEQPDP